MHNKIFLLIFIIIIIAFFFKFFIFGYIPIPGDILLGVYYPWLNNHWGFPTGVPVKNPAMSDVVSLIYPWRLMAINYLKSGQLPLWDASAFFGSSLIGNFQAGIFNPFNLLFFLPISFNYVWGIQTVLQPLIAMFCMFLLLKNWKLAPASILFGSISYGLSAQLLIWMEYNIHGFSIAVFPLIFYFIDKYFAQQKYIYLLGISLVFTFVVFAGYPQYLYYFLLASSIYFCFSLITFSRDKIFILKSLLSYGLSILLGLAVAAIQLLPGLEALQYSIRSVDTLALSNYVVSLPYPNLLMGILPDFFGNPTTYNYWGPGSYESVNFYTSLPALFLAIFSLKNSKFFLKSFVLTILLILVFLICLPTPVLDLTQKLSWLGLQGSAASRVLFIYPLVISALAAIGLDYLLELNKESMKLFFLNLLLPGLVLGVIILTGSYYLLLKSESSSITLTHLQISLRNSIWPLIIIIIYIITSWFLIKWRFKWISYLLILLLIADMFRFGWKYIPFTKSAQIFPTTPSLTFLSQQPKPFRLTIESGALLTANTWSPYGLENPAGYNILLPRNSADYVSTLNSGAPGLSNSRFIRLSNYDSLLFDAANIRYLIFLLRDDKAIPNKNGHLPDFAKNMDKYNIRYQEGPVVVLENSNSLDRAYTVNNFTIKSAAFNYISSSNFDPRNEVVLNQDPHLDQITKCEVQTVYYSPEQLKLETTCPKKGLLVVSNSYHPGWQAFVNNKQTQVFKANGAFLAFALPNGKSEVNLVFNPDSFWWGLKISLLSLLVLIVFFWKLKSKKFSEYN